jgi:hypothetical protein
MIHLISTIVIAAATGAASAAGGWAWNEITHLHRHVKLLHDRLTTLEATKLRGE